MSVKRVEVLAVLLVSMSAACSGEADLPATSLAGTAAVETTTSQSLLTEPPTSTTLAATAETAAAIELASAFLDAYWAFDADQALGYLAEEALYGQDPEEFRLEHAQRKAWRNMYRPAQPCRVVENTAAGVVVRCPYEYDSLGSDVVGFGPFTDNYEDLTVLDGEIVAWATHDPNGFAFSQHVWKPFEAWARSKHPEDADVLFEDEWWLTEESFRLWEQRIAEYIEFKTGP
jgi:hypothetical protein